MPRPDPAELAAKEIGLLGAVFLQIGHRRAVSDQPGQEKQRRAFRNHRVARHRIVRADQGDDGHE